MTKDEPTTLTVASVKAEAAVWIARLWKYGLMAAGILCIVVAWPIASEMNRQERFDNEAAAAQFGTRLRPEKDSSGVFWFGVTLLALSQLKSIEVAVREGNPRRHPDAV